MDIFFNAFMAITVSIIVYIFYNNGLLEILKPFRDRIPKMTIVGFRFRATYQKKVLALRVVKRKLEKYNIKLKYCGLFFDDNKSKPDDKLRSFIGAIIVDPTEENVVKLKDDLKKLELEIVEVEEQKDGVHVIHKIGTIFRSLSITFAPMRARGAIVNYICDQPELKNSDFSNYGDKNIPRYEIYDEDKKQIHYIIQNCHANEILPDFK